MAYEPIKIGKHTINIPIVQGGMGVGISWDKLAGSVSKEGALGVVSCVGVGYYEDKKFAKRLKQNRPLEAESFYARDALFEIFKNARKICNDAPLGANILYAINDYGRVVNDACEAGANIIITGAGLPTNMPEFTANFPDVACVPIVSSAKALTIIAKRWEQRYKKIPDALIVEGPLSGGHQGFTYEQCFLDEYKLENILPPIIKRAKEIGDIPVIAAGGIWDKNDIEQFLELGARGVQMGTRFIGTYECDASEEFKNIIINAKKDDIELLKSPVGYPARGIKTELLRALEEKSAPKVNCISNCVIPCKRGVEAKAVGYCIADRLADAYMGDVKNGLYFSGSNGYRIESIISVKELIDKLVNGE